MATRRRATRKRSTTARKPAVASRATPLKPKALPVYKALRRKGMAKGKAGAIANASANGTINYVGRPR